MVRSVAVAAAIGSTVLAQTIASNVYSDSFPTNDEYDFKVLDPNTVFGSPYGGFSRASRSRLAALPLHFPGMDDSLPSEDTRIHYEIRDGDGRRFVCRTYHEDELEANSISASMFDLAIEKLPPDSNQPTTDADVVQEAKLQANGDTGQVDKKVSHTSYSESDPKNIHTSNDEGMADHANGSDGHDHPTNQRSGIGPAEEIETKTIQTLKPLSNLKVPEADDKRLERLMSKLNGVCAQSHRGWWSYEFCYEKYASQFHVHVEKNGDLKLQDIAILGEFSHRQVQVFGDSQKSATTAEHGIRKMGTVVDYFEGGDTCEESGMPRKTSVEYQCCAMDKKETQNQIMFEGLPVNSIVATIVSITESEVCSYEVVVCTPILCEGAAELYGEDFGLPRKKEDTIPALEVAKPQREILPRKENESIRETLDRVLSDSCLQTNLGGWWIYEFCHGQRVRQVHEGKVMDQASGFPKNIIETEHILGEYPEHDLENFPNDEEVDYVVNPLKGIFGAKAGEGIRGPPTGGSGAYFVQEYIGGDVCDHSDVTDSAIKSGNVGEGHIERATTIRFFCGQQLTMTRVSEDATCHYLIDVTIPDLCENSLFAAPAHKKTVVKCLPAPD